MNPSHKSSVHTRSSILTARMQRVAGSVQDIWRGNKLEQRGISRIFPTGYRPYENRTLVDWISMRCELLCPECAATFAALVEPVTAKAGRTGQPLGCTSS